MAYKPPRGDLSVEQLALRHLNGLRTHLALLELDGVPLLAVCPWFKRQLATIEHAVKRCEDDSADWGAA